MRGEYNRLNEVLISSISALDGYTESLNNYVSLLEHKFNFYNGQKELHKLKLQKQSLLTTMSIIKNLKIKKLNLLEEFPILNYQGMSLDEFVNFKIKLNIKEENGDNIHKHITLKLRLKDYFYLRSQNQSIDLRLNLKDNKSNLSKVINLKIKFNDPT